MPTKLLALLVAVSLAACVDDASSPDETDTATVTNVTAEPATPPSSQGSGGVTPERNMPGPSLCEMLPTDPTNPCSHLCDDDFASYLPPHTCVELACPLTDGTIYRAGGCTP